MPRCLKLLCSSMIIFVVACAVDGQTSTPLYMPSRGIVPNGSYSISQIEAIDGVSGNLSLHVPITALPPGRAGFSQDVSLNYNSSIFVWLGTQLGQSNLWDDLD